MMNPALRTMGVTIVPLLLGLASGPVLAEDPFPHDFLQLEHSQVSPKEGQRSSGLSGRLSIELGRHKDHWLVVERDDLTTEAFNDHQRQQSEYTAVLLGTGYRPTDEGMWFVEMGPAVVRNSGQSSRQSIVAAFGIRTQISPRFELGGGPRLASAGRFDPEDHEVLMRVNGRLTLSEQISIAGSFDYHEDHRQWRLGAQLRW